MINAIIGSSIFGLPSELTRLLGESSTVAVILGGVASAVIMACLAEVASQFPQAGGTYLYARETFGRFAGIQVGWFSWLNRIASAAAGASIFGSYASGLAPSLDNRPGHTIAMGVVLGGLVAMNCIGVKSGAGVSTATVIARLVPLAVLIAFAVPLMLQRTSVAQMLAVKSHTGADWFEAFLLISFLYGGYDTALMSMGEVENPRRSAPFALAAGLVTCIVVYSLCQQVVVVTVGASTTPRPLAEAAGQIFGTRGALMITVAALISTLGYLSASVLNVPRLMFSISEHGDFPGWFRRIHPRFQTPYVAIIVFGILVFAMAATGSFRWAVAISAGARLITYGCACAALIPLRARAASAKAFRIPWGPALSALAVLMTLVLIARVHQREATILMVTAAIAALNWWFVTRRNTRKDIYK
jgi:basic amino acid/polyamine antiporter, APA family